jgi:hypothetical protein
MPTIAHPESAPGRAAPIPHFPGTAPIGVGSKTLPAHPAQDPHPVPAGSATPLSRPLDAPPDSSHPAGPDLPAPQPHSASTPSEQIVYEWDLFIEAPFPIDLLKLLFAILRLPGQVIRRSSETASGRLSFALRVLSYNFGIIALVLAAIPLALFVFSYIATLPFIILRTLANWTGNLAMTWIAGFVFAGALALVVYLYNVLFRPEAWRDNYKRTKIDLLNIFINAGFFIAGGALEFLIASPAFFIAKDFKGSTDSTLQWTLYFADKSLNLLFANIPQRYIGDLSNISTIRGGDGVAIGLLRILLIFGYVIGVRLVALKLFFSRRELFYGTVEECRRYLDLCGKAEAFSLRRVIDTPGMQSIYLRSRFAPRRPLVGAPPREGRPPSFSDANGNGNGNGNAGANGQDHGDGASHAKASKPSDAKILNNDNVNMRHGLSDTHPPSPPTPRDVAPAANPENHPPAPVQSPPHQAELESPDHPLPTPRPGSPAPPSPTAGSPAHPQDQTTLSHFPVPPPSASQPPQTSRPCSNPPPREDSAIPLDDD